MKYYVGIRETMIGRARAASSATLAADSIANSLQQAKNHKKTVTTTLLLPYKPLYLLGL
ncbi:MAG: hypothetical protein ACYSSI_02960 [Planctomycetota bacterium]|jgi:hypothetical protein